MNENIQSDLSIKVDDKLTISINDIINKMKQCINILEQNIISNNKYDSITHHVDKLFNILNETSNESSIDILKDEKRREKIRLYTAKRRGKLDESGNIIKHQNKTREQINEQNRIRQERFRNKKKSNNK
jgi:hypothetical protein